MKKYYICNNEGKLIGSGFTQMDTVSKMSENEHIFFSNNFSDDMYHDFSTNSLKERPRLTYDVFKKIMKNENYILTDIPKNTKILVNDIDYGNIDDGKLVISFPVEMLYHVKLIPPFPYYEKTITIEVTNG